MCFYVRVFCLSVCVRVSMCMYVCMHVCVCVCIFGVCVCVLEMQQYIDISSYHDTLGSDTVSIHIKDVLIYRIS